MKAHRATRTLGRARRRPLENLALWLGLGFSVVPRLAQGQEPAAEGVLAEALYRQGRALMADGKVNEACPKFAESYQVDAATGTLLNLASCHEAQGKLASAWLEFSRAVSLARRDRRQDRVRFAQERLAVIEPKLSYLAVVVPPESEHTGLDVRVDGVPVRGVARGTSTPADPGNHTVEAIAPGRKPWSQNVSVTEETRTVTVAIPPLEPAELAASPTVDRPSPAPTSRAAPVPASVYVAGGVTLALASAAGVTAYIYMDHRARDGVEQREPDLSRNQRLGAINLALDLGALVGAGVTTYLYLTRPDVGPSARLGATPWFERGAVGFSLTGSY